MRTARGDGHRRLTKRLAAIVLGGVAPASFGITGVFIAAAVVFFAYSGFEAVANLGEETNDRRERAADVERLPRLRTDRTGPESGVERHAPAHPQAGTQPARIGLILR